MRSRKEDEESSVDMGILVEVFEGSEIGHKFITLS